MKVIPYLFLTLCLIATPLKMSAEEDETKGEAEVSEEIAPAISIEEKVGQLFLIGFQGTEFDSSLKDRVEKIKPGGLIFFKRNIVNTNHATKLIYQIQKYNFDKKRIPIFTAIDQEGGVVTRIRTNPPLPSALAMGRSKNTKTIYAIGTSTGKKLKATGFNLNLAPVLDLSDPNKFSFIGNRSFGHNPATASAAAIQFSKGVESAGVLSTAKHFPGHGDVDADSHIELPVSKLKKEELMDLNVHPYKKSIEENAISAVMMAHMSYPNIDENYPATYSKKIIDILKTELNFKGIVLTDDIQMLGANIYSSISERAVQAFLAGNDMIMVAWSFPDQLEAYNGVLEAVKSGRIPESRVDESYQKIHKLKEQFNLFEAPSLSAPRSLAEDKDSELRLNVENIFKEILDQEKKKIELSDLKNMSKQPFVVISSDESFLSEFKKAKIGRKTILVRLRKNMSYRNLELFKQRGRSFTGVVQVSGPVTAKIVNRMPKSLRDSFILVNNYFPGSISNLEAFHSTIDIPIKDASMGRSIAGWLKNPPQKPAPTDEDSLEVSDIK